VVSDEKALQKPYQTQNKIRIHPYMSVLKLSLLADLPTELLVFNHYFRKYFKLVCENI
jgi:hypothetical protein